MPPFEVLLPLGAIGLYVFDSVLWLYSNEIVFLRRRNWDLITGSGILIAGRRLHLPNPLTPATPPFRVRWSQNDPRQGEEDPAELDRFVAALRPIQYLVVALLVLLTALPLELLWLGTGPGLLVLFAAFYLVIGTALSYIFIRRRELQISGGAFLSLAFDSLACAPFSINLVRKISLRRSLVGNPIALARRTFEPTAFARLIQSVCARIVEEQRREHGQTQRWNELETYRQELLSMLTA
jgi:hypothetical protein